MWFRGAWLLPLAPALYAHVVSMSTGELRMDGPTAVYELRIPAYEASHAANPEKDLLDHIRFADGHRTRSSCHEEDGTYICRAEYEFPGLHPNALDVECTLFQVTVPNHVHLLTAVQGPNTDQLVFDRTFTEGEARFHPPSRAEVVVRESSRAVKRTFQNAAGLLFLVALALAARSRNEAIVLAAVFLGSEWLARPIGSRIPVAFSARFFEAALALTVAYLAVEILLLPEGRLRWLVVAVLGLFHGLSMAAFPPIYQAGGTAAQAIAIAPLAAGAIRLPKDWRIPAAALVLAAALGWFVFRLMKP
ncbi:MAG TPA: HupE/UreJ family protein [Bryobacteraceae bacterium]|jgi:hypothetical protein